MLLPVARPTNLVDAHAFHERSHARTTMCPRHQALSALLQFIIPSDRRRDVAFPGHALSYCIFSRLPVPQSSSCSARPPTAAGRSPPSPPHFSPAPNDSGCGLNFSARVHTARRFTHRPPSSTWRPRRPDAIRVHRDVLVVRSWWGSPFPAITVGVILSCHRFFARCSSRPPRRRPCCGGTSSGLGHPELTPILPSHVIVPMCCPPSPKPSSRPVFIYSASLSASSASGVEPRHVLGGQGGGGPVADSRFHRDPAHRGATV